jgi:hypothetical protein
MFYSYFKNGKGSTKRFEDLALLPGQLKDIDQLPDIFEHRLVRPVGMDLPIAEEYFENRFAYCRRYGIQITVTVAACAAQAVLSE